MSLISIKDIRIRDPFVLNENGVYYMYGTTHLTSGINAGNTFSVYTSRDLVYFDGPFTVMQGGLDDRDCWAAEVHKFNGKYYLFGSLVHPNKKRCSEIFVSDSPLGQFVYLSGATPKEWECLDATLYVEDGVPYSVFCHEWTEVGVGEIWAVKLKSDLSGFAAPPKLLFNAGAAPWVNVSKDVNGRLTAVTDGPFLVKQGENLLMLWSSFTRENKYALGCSRSYTIDGEWRQFESPIFQENGGHAMIFKNFDNETVLSLHCPNDSALERALFKKINVEDICKDLQRRNYV